MNKISRLLVCLVALPSSLWAQQPPDILGEVDTTWPGIHFQIFHVERIVGNRVLIGVKVVATPQAPTLGTQISVQAPIPKDVDPSLVRFGHYGMAPFSLDKAVMTDERTKQAYPVVPSDPAGPHYLPGQMIGTLHPNEAEVMTIQFDVPPPPPDGNGNIPKKIVSILLPNAKGPITRIEIPPPAKPLVPAGGQ